MVVDDGSSHNRLRRLSVLPGPSRCTKLHGISVENGNERVLCVDFTQQVPAMSDSEPPKKDQSQKKEGRDASRAPASTHTEAKSFVRRKDTGYMLYMSKDCTEQSKEVHIEHFTSNMRFVTLPMTN